MNLVKQEYKKYSVKKSIVHVEIILSTFVHLFSLFSFHSLCIRKRKLQYLFKITVLILLFPFTSPTS